jgi:hypothetical protein
LDQLPTPGDFEVDELVLLVAQRAQVPSAQAALAVSAMMDYLTARLPSPLVGRIRELLGEVPGARLPNLGNRGLE